jgi:hypothetical protein
MDRFYITLTYPPGVAEIDFSDPFGAYTYKIYIVYDTNSKYIGRKGIATNSKYVLHMMEDLITQ